MRRPSRALPALLLALSAAAPARAELHCPEPVVEVGEVRSGAQLQHRFTFVNRGPAPVEVREVRPSCGCLTPRLDRALYPPGAEGALLLEVNTLTADAGAQSWRVALRCRSGGEDQELSLCLRGRVVPELTLEPAALQISTTGPVSRTLTLTDPRAQPLTVVGVRTAAPQLHASLAGPGVDAQGRRTWTVRVEVGDDFPEGRREETLVISTSDPMYPELRAPVGVEKRPRRRVQASPEEVEVTAAPGQPVSRIVLLRGPDDEPVEVAGAECDGPAVRCTWAAGPGSLATLRLTLDPARLSGPEWRGQVRVRLARPAGQTVTVPVTCAVR
jgi:hypothetical protein